MASFKDLAGRTWPVVITVDVARRLRDRLKVDVLTEKLPELFARVLGDLILLCDVLFVIVERDAEKLKVTDEGFGSAMGGSALEEGADAFMQALVDFIPSPRERERVGRVITAVKSAAAEYQTKADVAVDRHAKTFLDAAASGELFHAAPESSESTPAR